MKLYCLIICIILLGCKSSKKVQEQTKPNCIFEESEIKEIKRNFSAGSYFDFKSNFKNKNVKDSNLLFFKTIMECREILGKTKSDVDTNTIFENINYLLTFNINNLDSCSKRINEFLNIDANEINRIVNNLITKHENLRLKISNSFSPSHMFFDSLHLNTNYKQEFKKTIKNYFEATGSSTPNFLKFISKKVDSSIVFVVLVADSVPSSRVYDVVGITKDEGVLVDSSTLMTTYFDFCTYNSPNLVILANFTKEYFAMEFLKKHWLDLNSNFNFSLYNLSDIELVFYGGADPVPTSRGKDGLSERCIYKDSSHLKIPYRSYNGKEKITNICKDSMFSNEDLAVLRAYSFYEDLKAREYSILNKFKSVKFIAFVGDSEVKDRTIGIKGDRFTALKIIINRYSK